MATTAELLQREAALEKALASGVSEVRHGERFVRFRSQAEIREALAAVRRELRAAPIGEIRFQTSKGLA